MLHAIPHAVFLHVEDNTDDARLFRETLEALTGNVRIRRVSLAETALDLLADTDEADGPPFDCVVTAVRLPGLNGGDLARRLRQRFDAASLPIIGLTRDAPVNEASAGWFDALFQKPDTSRGLRPVVQAIVDLWFTKARRYHC
ncbi:response regulator [Stappia sp.]|jgi:CheY-like chemotaxis protein|uniref:response regulator n=1 Tax=Stappia sp. TaxID=1870903 RepID=UPI003A9A5E37